MSVLTSTRTGREAILARTGWLKPWRRWRGRRQACRGRHGAPGGGADEVACEGAGSPCRIHAGQERGHAVSDVSSAACRPRLGSRSFPDAEAQYAEPEPVAGRASRQPALPELDDTGQ